MIVTCKNFNDENHEDLRSLQIGTVLKLKLKIMSYTELTELNKAGRYNTNNQDQKPQMHQVEVK